MTAPTTMRDLLSAHSFLDGIATPWLDRLGNQAKRTVHHGGTRIFREGARADRFWLLRAGRVALEFHVPGRGDVVIEHLGPGAVLGWA